MAKTAVVVQIPSDSQVACRLGKRSNVRLTGLQLAHLESDGSPAPLNLNKPHVGIASRSTDSADAFWIAPRFTPSNLGESFDR